MGLGGEQWWHFFIFLSVKNYINYYGGRGISLSFLLFWEEISNQVLDLGKHLRAHVFEVQASEFLSHAFDHLFLYFLADLFLS